MFCRVNFKNPDVVKVYMAPESDIKITGLHFLFTYTCLFECDHCFVYSGPQAEGTFTIGRIREVLEEAKKIGTIEMIFFEGGEAFLYYPVMVEGIRLAGEMGFNTGIVTNGYWATSVEDAEIWLRPLAELGMSDISISDDEFHYDDELNNAKNALEAAKKLGMPAGTISIQEPVIEVDQTGGKPVVGGGAIMKGRAVEKLAEGLPKRRIEEFTECPHEDLRNPKRVHLDPFGNVQLCQGISVGNMWDEPLSEIIRGYDPDAHPICGPILEGGPKELAKKYKIPHEDEYVSECHLCYLARKALIDKFPKELAPRQVYGLVVYSG